MWLVCKQAVSSEAQRFAGIYPLPACMLLRTGGLRTGMTNVAKYTSTLSQVEAVFRITVDQDLEKEMIVASWG